MADGDRRCVSLRKGGEVLGRFVMGCQVYLLK